MLSALTKEYKSLQLNSKIICLLLFTSKQGTGLHNRHNRVKGVIVTIVKLILHTFSPFLSVFFAKRYSNLSMTLERVAVIILCVGIFSSRTMGSQKSRHSANKISKTDGCVFSQQFIQVIRLHITRGKSSSLSSSVQCL